MSEPAKLFELQICARELFELAQEHIIEHFPSEEIAALAEKLGANLIVMGTRSLSCLEHVLLSSVAERIRLAPCPVLTLKIGGDQ